MMTDNLVKLEQEAMEGLAAAETEGALFAWKRAYLGRRGAVTEVLRGLKSLPPAERPAAGRHANALRERLARAVEARAADVADAAALQAAAWQAVDVTLPGRRTAAGRRHPIWATMRRMLAAFAQMGFQPFEGRDVETEEYNFTLLNMPPHHPARDSHDTFYATQTGRLLRTHTSPAQVRVMRKTGAPVRAVVPGACYRYDVPDASHNFMFYQMEGLAVGQGIRMGDLLGAITGLAQQLFGEGAELRFRGHYFPFTEPSIETDLRCTVCGGSGCRLCNGSGWVEVIPGGMIHPVVLRNGGIDPARHTGFAFGAGVDRIAALWYGIPDIRLLYENDARFLGQF
jgi:phenylalanyl-tRNA synthetase alpha chain